VASNANADINLVFEEMRASTGEDQDEATYFSDLRKEMENGVVTKDGIALHCFKARTESGLSFRTKAERLRLMIEEECEWTLADQKNYLILQAQTRDFVKDRGIDLSAIPNLPFEITKAHLLEKGYSYMEVYEMVWNSRMKGIHCSVNDCRILQHNPIDPFTKVIEMYQFSDIETYHEEAPKVEVACIKCHCDLSFGPDGDI
jgi:hypothetical protein